MAIVNRNLKIEKLKGGLSEQECVKIDEFFNQLNEIINLSLLNTTLLNDHFIDGFEYYLEKGKSIDQMCKILDIKNLGTFYSENQNQYYSLDNAAIVYPLGMKFGQMPMFRLAVELKEDIEPSLLQLALDFTIKRFPTFSAVIKNGFFWHYLETTNYIPLVEKEKDIPCKPISILMRTYRSFRVLYYKNRISVEYFHTITDGLGGMAFLKALLKEYMILKGKRITDDGTIININDEVKEEEAANEFKKAEGAAALSTFVDKKSLQLDGKISPFNLTRILHLEMDSKELKKVASSYNGTVTAYITALEFLAAREAIKKNNGIFNIQIPVNMRKFNGSKTLRNYSMYFNATMDLSALPESRKELVEEIGKQIREKGDEKTMNQMMMTTGKVITSLSFIPLFLKVLLMQMLYGYLGNSIIGSTLSNLGVIEFPKGMKEAVNKVFFVFPPGRPNRVTTSLATFNDRVIFTVVKNCHDQTFENALYRLLKEDGLEIECEGSVEYES